MSTTVNIYYSGKNGSARQFAREMMESGTVAAIREEPGNLQYAYFYPLEDEETVLLIDSWENQEAIDAHQKIPLCRAKTLGGRGGLLRTSAAEHPSTCLAAFFAGGFLYHGDALKFLI